MSRGSTFFDRLERRKAGRVRCAQTQCQLGPVGNLSRDGCRVICKQAISVPEGESINLRLTVAGVSLVAVARPVACRKRGDGRYDVGFQFVRMTDLSRRELTALARAALDSAACLHLRSA